MPKIVLVSLSVAPDTVTIFQAPACEGALLTVGQLAHLVRRTAARPQRWWHLVRFCAAEVPVPAQCEMWLAMWPPGHTGSAGAPDDGQQVMMTLAGELTVSGGIRLPANGILSCGAGVRTVTNNGLVHAVSLHARSGPVRERRQGHS